MQNLSHENEFDLHQNDYVGGTCFHTNGFGFKWKIQHGNGQLNGGHVGFPHSSCGSWTLSYVNTFFCSKSFAHSIANFTSIPRFEYAN